MLSSRQRKSDGKKSVCVSVCEIEQEQDEENLSDKEVCLQKYTEQLHVEQMLTVCLV